MKRKYQMLLGNVKTKHLQTDDIDPKTLKSLRIQFPDRKVAKVIPLYKAGDRDHFTNYRLYGN